MQDALAQTNALPDSFQNTIAESQTLYTRLNAIEGCFGLGRLELNVNTIPIPNEIDDHGTKICSRFSDTVCHRSDLTAYGLYRDQPSARKTI